MKKEKKRKIYPDKLLWRVMSDSGQQLKEHYDIAIAYLEGGSAYFVHDHVQAEKKCTFLHVDYGYAGYTRELDRECYLDFDRIFTVSKEVMQSFLAVYPECTLKTRVFHNLIDQEEIKRKSLLPGGFEDSYDGKRILTVGRLTAQKSYETAIDAMKLLKDHKLPFGISTCYTSANYQDITSEEFFDMMIEDGALFAWFFHYMPVGNDAVPELMPNPDQRETVYRRIREYRKTKSIFTMDFQNDAEFVHGCVAGGRYYLHINAAGDVDPCVFIHYSNCNIHEHTLLEALKSPLFMAYHRAQPFNDNMFQPCPMLENSGRITELVKASGAKSTDPQSPESAEHLCGKTKAYAEAWAPRAEKLWKERQEEIAEKKAAQNK